MLRLSKKVEYGILAMQYMAAHPRNLFTAKSLSENLHLSYDFLAKTMQKLMRAGLLDSQQGTKGGYFLAKPAESIRLMDILESLESRPELVDCVSDEKDCEKKENCYLHGPIQLLQKKVEDIFLLTTVQDIVEYNFVEIETNNNRG
ncbi:MAG: Rrf2 family transcriptional regulator [Candidatus Kapaibacterium sp.]|nr:Rrf2 family transcriptional regulator [Ignavibacteriota bacterium]MCB9222320.1 Rrf2 family transcriptional regulator [Ignavibacteria bacterium]